MKPLALDIGNRYIGVAATDHMDHTLAYRYATIDRKSQDALDALGQMIRSESIDTLVFGVPYHVEDGSETQQTKKTRDFIALVKEKFNSSVSYVEVDETLTSVQARDSIRRDGLDGSHEHAEAARIMLAEYLNAEFSPPHMRGSERGS